MSLNKFTDSTIKSYLNIGANTVNCLNLQINGTTVYPSNSSYDNATITASSGTISNATVYITTNRNVMTMNVRAVLTTLTDITSVFIDVNLPLLISADITKEANCIGNITGPTSSLTSKQCILQNSTTLRSQYVGPTLTTSSDNWLNASYTFTYL